MCLSSWCELLIDLSHFGTRLAMEKPVESKDERSSPAEKVKAALAVRVDNTALESESFDVGPAGEALSAAVINDTDLGSNRTVPGPTIPTAGHPFHVSLASGVLVRRVCSCHLS